jgi:3-hydroxybutyryl-CoA dehydrogenase
MKDVRTIVVVGSGTMGVGIAQVAAMAGYDVKIFDIAPEALEKAKEIINGNLDKGIEKGKITEEIKTACLEKVSWTAEFNDLTGDLIIEAIKEDLEVKANLFTNLAGINDADTILATNTSSIPITQIAARIDHPERVVGMHFFNPAHIMKLVEVISGAATDPGIAQGVKAIAEKMGKTVIMAADAPGFIVNRVARHYYVESLKALEEDVAPMETIDDLMESVGFKMGPYRLMDLLGVDNNFSVTVSMFNSFYQDAKFRPSRIQQQKVDAGHHGRKSGKGFYDYSN